MLTARIYTATASSVSPIYNPGYPPWGRAKSRGVVVEFRPAANKPLTLRDVIGDFRSTPEGERAWKFVEKHKSTELKKAFRAKKLNSIKYHRLLRKMTQSELAATIGSKQSNIARYERLLYRPSRRTLDKLAVVFNVKAADLL